MLKFHATLSSVAVKDISDNLPKDIQLYYFGHDPNANIIQAMNLITELERCSMAVPVTDHKKSPNGKFNVSHDDAGIMFCFLVINMKHFNALYLGKPKLLYLTAFFDVCSPRL